MPRPEDKGAIRYAPEGFTVCYGTRARHGLYGPGIDNAHVYFKTSDAGEKFAKSVGVAETGEQEIPTLCTIKMLDIGKQCNVHIQRRL